jgi:hypothetical protein
VRQRGWLVPIVAAVIVLEGCDAAGACLHTFEDPVLTIVRVEGRTGVWHIARQRRVALRHTLRLRSRGGPVRVYCEGPRLSR